MDASIVSKTSINRMLALTLQKFLASIFLKECFMDNRRREIVDHQVKDRLNFLFAITSIVRDGSILV